MAFWVPTRNTLVQLCALAARGVYFVDLSRVRDGPWTVFGARISQSGSKALSKWDTRNHGL